jgi:class 3 adenylate cyclase
VSADLAFRATEVRYAQVADAHVAYRVIAGAGTGTHDVVLSMSGTLPMEALFVDPVGVRLLDGLAELGRLVVFDRRGIGLSDPPTVGDAAGLTRWREDLEAVIAASGAVRPVLVMTRELAPAFLYCDRFPDNVSSIVTLEPVWDRPDPELLRGQFAGEIDSIALWCPSRAAEPGFREWFTRAGQMGASPRMAEHAYPVASDDEVHEVERAAARLPVPLLVLRRPAHPWSPDRTNDPILALVPGAVRVDLPGADMLLYGGEIDAFLAEVSRFVTGSYRVPEPERVLTSVLYSDLVASTERATAMGDAHWKRLLDQHDAACRACVGRRGGTVIKTTGDGILAMIPSVTNALRVGQELRTALRDEGLEVRVGIHVGDVDRRGDDISGIAAVIAARVLALAAPGEILVTSAVVATMPEGGHFDARGEHQLKGVPGTWPLFAITTRASPS